MYLLYNSAVPYHFSPYFCAQTDAVRVLKNAVTPSAGGPSYGVLVESVLPLLQVKSRLDSLHDSPARKSTVRTQQPQHRPARDNTSGRTADGTEAGNGQDNQDGRHLPELQGRARPQRNLQYLQLALARTRNEERFAPITVRAFFILRKYLLEEINPVLMTIVLLLSRARR